MQRTKHLLIASTLLFVSMGVPLIIWSSISHFVNPYWLYQPIGEIPIQTAVWTVIMAVWAFAPLGPAYHHMCRSLQDDYQMPRLRLALAHSAAAGSAYLAALGLLAVAHPALYWANQHLTF
ncbi:MAG: hypothetical protein ABH846_02650 [Patescibacteria group bacterium]